MTLYSGGLIIGLIFPRRLIFVLFLLLLLFFFGGGGVGGRGQGLIIEILRHVIFSEKSFRPLGIRVKTG